MVKAIYNVTRKTLKSLSRKLASSVQMVHCLPFKDEVERINLMTQNQIAYLQNEETKRNNMVMSEETGRHNRAMEQETHRQNMVIAGIQQADLAEKQRANKAAEKNTRRGQNIQRKNAKTQAKASKYGAKKSASASKYSARKSAAASKYGAKTAAAASRYSANKSAAATKYSTDKSYSAQLKKMENDKTLKRWDYMSNQQRQDSINETNKFIASMQNTMKKYELDKKTAAEYKKLEKQIRQAQKELKQTGKRDAAKALNEAVSNMAKFVDAFIPF